MPPAKQVGKGSGKKRKREEDYASKEYWEERYKEGVEWEWYYKYEDIKPLLDGCLKHTNRILDLGCGDKPLAWDMVKDGYTGEICSVDFAPTIIEKLKELQQAEYGENSNNVKFSVEDGRRLSYPDESFDAVIDKGTTDAMLSDESGVSSARDVCAEAGRVLKEKGVLVIVSHLHPQSDNGVHFLDEVLMKALHRCGDEVFWRIEVHSPETDDNSETDEGDEDDSASAPCVYIAHKFARRKTRAAAQGKRETVVTLHQH